MRLIKIICNRTPKIWLPLAIVLLNGVINFLGRVYLFADLFQTYDDIQYDDIQIIGGFFGIAMALIDWILISVLLFFGCRLLCDSKGIFRNFFKIVGLCHLVLLVASLGQFIFILIGLPSLPPELTTLEFNNTTSLQESSEVTLEALASVELPVQRINIAGHICFGVILIAVVQTFFEIRSGQALFITCFSYAIYWVLSEASGSAFLHAFFFFFGQFFVPSWQPGDPISP
ncbi:MAG: hypothetical protein OXI63_13490 [Candidatus Poribacteria bacterium]|nr:hypothetical protein [Candidatus Poribacteria bacterium]